MVGYYQPPLVVLSILISIVASYAALDLAGRVTSARGGNRFLWLSGGATAMGIGIWSMHYVGMLAFRLPVPVQYDWPTVVLSLLAAMFASAVALFVASRPKMGLFRACVGSIVMGAGIAAMHYIGMAAMRLPAMCSYSPALVTLSVGLAIVISFVALWLTFHFRAETTAGGWLKIVSALVMGAAIPVMHYTGMAAASFAPSPMGHQDLSHAVSISSLGLTAIVGVTLSALGLVLLTSMADRRFSIQITGREEAEAALRETEERMHFSLEAAGVGTWHMNLLTGIGQWSPKLEALHGVEGGTFPGTVEAFLGYVYPDDRAMVRDAIDQGIRQRTDWNVVYRTIWPDGSLHSVNEIGRAFYDEAGVPLRTAGVGMDVTDRQRSEAQSRQAQKMEAIGQLAGGVSHDFNNLLTAIIGFCELGLARLEPDHPVRADLQEILNAGHSAASLTRQLLAFSRRQMLQPQILDLNAVIGRMEEFLRRTIGEQVQLVTRLDPRVGRVSADPGQIDQVVMNLVVNARDAMPMGGVVTVETGNVNLDEAFAGKHPGASTGPHVAIAISDTGGGIDESVRTRLFEPFFTTKAQGKGTGLGLATVYGIVRQSGGFIRVDSELGRGTTFTIYLQHAEQSSEESWGPSPTTNPPGGTETILLVEDQPDVRAVARATLVRHGYTVIEAARGEEALQLTRQYAGVIHLLLTDVVMPGMNGRELGRLFLEQRPEIHVLYTSGYTDHAIVQHGVLEPGLAFLQKPFSPNSLLRKVRDTLDAAASPSERSL
jgi:NO-binding membrane sensor protein with MHYT domain/signal transduction histidine kinase/ActR/RegA family two-component response regulator